MRIIELAVVGAVLLASAIVGTAIAATWQPAHTNMLLMVFGIGVTLMFVAGGLVFGFAVGWRITKGGRNAPAVQQPQVIGGMGRPLPPPPALLGAPGATNAGTYNSAGNYIMPAMSEPWGEVD
jgi:hypothetical protein